MNSCPCSSKDWRWTSLNSWRSKTCGKDSEHRTLSPQRYKRWHRDGSRKAVELIQQPWVLRVSAVRFDVTYPNNMKYDCEAPASGVDRTIAVWIVAMCSRFESEASLQPGCKLENDLLLPCPEPFYKVVSYHSWSILQTRQAKSLVAGDWRRRQNFL